MDKILIVDDEKITLFFLREVLEENGYEVAGEAMTGEEALKETFEQNPDLIIMDVKMPGAINGIEAGKKIKEMKNIPIIYLTAYENPEFIEEMKSTEFMGYLTKPFNKNELLSAVYIAIYRKKMENELLILNEKNKNELSQKNLIYQILEVANRKLDPIMDVEKMLKIINEYYNPYETALYFVNEQENDFFKSYSYMSSNNKSLIPKSLPIGKSNKKFTNSIIENLDSLPDEVTSLFLKEGIGKVIMKSLEIEKEFFGYIIIYWIL